MFFLTRSLLILLVTNVLIFNNHKANASALEKEVPSIVQTTQLGRVARITSWFLSIPWPCKRTRGPSNRTAVTTADTQEWGTAKDVLAEQLTDKIARDTGSIPLTVTFNPLRKDSSKMSRIFSEAKSDLAERKLTEDERRDHTVLLAFIGYMIDTESTLGDYNRTQGCASKTTTALKSWWFWKRFLSLSGGLGVTASTFNIFTNKVWPRLMYMPENYTYDTPTQCFFMVLQVLHAHVFLQIIYTSQGEQLLNSWENHFHFVQRPPNAGLVNFILTYFARDAIKPARPQYRLLENAALRIYSLLDSLPGVMFLASRLVKDGTYYTAAGLFAYTLLNYYQRKTLTAPIGLSWHTYRLKKTEDVRQFSHRIKLIQLLEEKSLYLRHVDGPAIDALYTTYFKSLNRENIREEFLKFLFNIHPSEEHIPQEHATFKTRKRVSYFGSFLGLLGSFALFEGIKSFASQGLEYLGESDQSAYWGTLISGILISSRFVRNARNTSSMFTRIYDIATNFNYFTQTKTYNPDIHTHISRQTKLKSAVFSLSEGIFWSLPWVVFSGYGITSAAFWIFVPPMLLAEGSFLGLQFDKDLANAYRLKGSLCSTDLAKTERHRTKILETIDVMREVLRVANPSLIRYMYRLLLSSKNTSSSL